ncbi:hypothetical protein ACLK15_10410 [Escherichia coli]
MSCKGLDINSGALDGTKRKLKSKSNEPSGQRNWMIGLITLKFDRKAFVQLADFSHINYIITDKLLVESG